MSKAEQKPEWVQPNNTGTIFSPGYERRLQRNREETWYDVYPFASVLWAQAITDITRHGQWQLTRVNYHQIALELELEKEVVYIQNGEKIILYPGELHLTRPGDTVVMRSSGSKPSRQLQLLISGNNTQSILDSLKITQGMKFRFEPSDAAFFRSRMESFFPLLQKKDLAESWTNSLRCNELLLFLADCIRRKQHETEKYPLPVMILLKIMNTAYDQHHSIQELAQHCGVSDRSVFRLFKKYIGVTPHTYHQRLLMEKARYLLKNSNDSIKEIAGKLGFLNAFYFSSTFSRFTGVSPSDYRKTEPQNVQPAH